MSHWAAFIATLGIMQLKLCSQGGMLLVPGTQGQDAARG